MRITNKKSKLIWILIVLGAMIAGGAFARSHWTWFARLCGFTQAGCSHADLYELLGIPISLWGFGFYLFAGLVFAWLPAGLPFLVIVGAGVELALIYEMLSQQFACQICLANAVVIGLLVMLHLKYWRSWRSIAICLMAFWGMNIMLFVENRDLNSGCTPISGSEVVAQVKGQTITLTDLESEIATPLNDMRKDIYFLKRNHLEELIKRILDGQSEPATTSRKTEMAVSTQGAKGDTADAAQRIVADLQRTQPDIDRYLERPISPFTQIRIGDSPSLGPEDAKVTIIAFTDFRCPLCKAVFPIVKELQKTYKDSVRWVSKDFPSRQHAGAIELAEAAQCAHDQGRYWEFREALFTTDNTIEPDALPQLAQRLGLNLDEFAQCVEDKKYAQVVEKNIEDAGTAGVSVTPSFIINGRLYVGGMSAENFKRQIDEALRR